MNLNNFYQIFINSKSKGFTLIELSVVLIIISLIIAGVLGGQDLIKQSKLQLMIKEINELESAISNFEEKFKYLPGDYPKSAIQFSGKVPNGNGDWKIDRDESASIASSLFLSNDIKKQYAISSGDLRTGENIIKSSLNSGAYWFITHQSGLGSNVAPIYGKSSESIDYAFYTDEDNIKDGIIDSQSAISIDKKIDDGLADSGYVYASVGQNFDETNGCVDALPSANSANYVLTRESSSCRLHFWYDRKSK